MTLSETASRAPIAEVTLAPFHNDDLAELVVLQRCCWVQEALANDTLDIPALHETTTDVQTWAHAWTTLVVRQGPRGRLVAAVRGRLEGTDWQIGRLMVAPDLEGRGLGSWLLHVIEQLAPEGVERLILFTGGKSRRNIATYTRAGYRLADLSHPPPAGHISGVVFMEKPRPATSPPANSD